MTTKPHETINWKKEFDKRFKDIHNVSDWSLEECSGGDDCFKGNNICRSKMKTKPHETINMKKREIGTGRYAFEKMDLLCTCGHSLGKHDAERAKDKQYCQNEDEFGNLCDCEYFTKKPIRK